MSLVGFFPHDSLGIVSLTNTDEGSIVNYDLVLRIASDYFGQPIDELYVPLPDMFASATFQY